MTQASIITIGDELLIGQVIDTNSAWMAQELNKAGIRVCRRVAVGDVWGEIWNALDEESKHADIILITGGLGPTADDITKPLLCKYFNGKLIVDETALANVKYLFELVFKRPLTDRNIKQAEVPDTCKVIQNKRAYLPNYGMVRLRLSSAGFDAAAIDKEIDGIFIRLQSLVKEYMVTNADEPMENVVAKLLLQYKKTVSTAESCTGGYIASLITARPGSSAYYNGSVVSYSYQAKEDLLGVNKNTLETLGAVSEEVVREMATGALKKLQTDYTIAVSGIMGPGGGTEGKPAGTVWIAVGSNEKMVTQKFHFRFDRQRNIELTAMNALNLLRKFILSNG
ncbi:MAG: nicotinamide-nucleotide amidohydrolase family protein [Chitinophagaceae bacterium]|nr:nicotinamide-nucleotide amidohydrolase family protein [Chitinophagaceae bacterium]